MKFSMNTNSIRKKYNCREIIRIAGSAGVQGLEWGLGRLDQAESEAKEAARAAADAGLEIISFLNGGQLWKTDLIRRWSDAVKAGGGHILRVSHPWFACSYEESFHQPDDFMKLVDMTREGLTRLMELGREYQIRYVLETHCGSCFASPLMVPLLLSHFDPRYCGVIYDPANTILEGFLRPRAAVEVMKDYIAYIHIKNLAFTERKTVGGQPVFGWERRTVDSGMADYTELMFALKLHHWDGWCSFEEFIAADAEGVAAEIRHDIKHVTECCERAKEKVEEPFLPFNR